jgi:hypothetical protein
VRVISPVRPSDSASMSPNSALLRTLHRAGMGSPIPPTHGTAGAAVTRAFHDEACERPPLQRGASMGRQQGRTTRRPEASTLATGVTADKPCTELGVESCQSEVEGLPEGPSRSSPRPLATCRYTGFSGYGDTPRSENPAPRRCAFAMVINHCSQGVGCGLLA